MSGIASMCFAAQSFAQPEKTTSNPTVWNRDFVEGYCTITTGSADMAGLSLRMTPGDPDPQLYVIGSPKSVPAELPENGKVVLSPSGQSFAARVLQMPRRSPSILLVTQLGDKFSAAFAQASELSLIVGPATITIPIRGAAKASTALQECIDWKLTEWGVDPKFWAALQTPPIDPTDKGWVSGDDYPQDALIANAMGHVIARLNVDAAGKVSDCKVVVSSGRLSLDDATCRLALKRAKYIPAHGANGQPISSPRIVNVSWMIEG